MKRTMMLGMAVVAVSLMMGGEASARGGRCGGFFGGHGCGGQVSYAPSCGVSYGCGGQVSYSPAPAHFGYAPSYGVSYAPTCGVSYGQPQTIRWAQPTYRQYGPAPLPSSSYYGSPTIIRPAVQTPSEVVPPAPKKGPAPLPSKETSSNVEPTRTYYLINGVYYLASN